MERFRFRSSPAIRATAGLVVGASLLLASLASAEPNRGGPVTIHDANDRSRPLASDDRPVLIVYTDRDSERQNEHIHPLLTRVSDERNRGRLELVPVADVEEYNFWPARPIVLAYVRKIIRRENIRIFFDWRGEVRQAYGLKRKQSAFVLLARDGTVLFTTQGRVTAEAEAELEQHLAAAGVITGP